MGGRLSHLSTQTLARELPLVFAGIHSRTASAMEYVGEFDARHAYLPAGYQSMLAYCVGELHRDEQAALKLIRAARIAHKFPVPFDAVADGRLHLTGVILLKPHLTDANVDELLAAAAHKTRTEIELLLAERFPKPDVPTRVEDLSPPLALDLTNEV